MDVPPVSETSPRPSDAANGRTDTLVRPFRRIGDDAAAVGRREREDGHVCKAVPENPGIEQLHVGRVRLDSHDCPMLTHERRGEERDHSDVCADVDERLPLAQEAT